MDGLVSLKQGEHNRRRFRVSRFGLVLLSIILAIIIWSLAARLGNFPAFILPMPLLVWQRFIEVLLDGSLPRHTLSTLGEVLLGLMLGVSVATTLGYLLAKSPVMERLLSPYVVASQSVPVVAIAPLLVIWFGTRHRIPVNTMWP